MKLELAEQETDGCLEMQQLFINGKLRESVSPLCECPEDAIIGRGLISCDDIIDYMKMAYEAGKAGETLDISDRDWED